MVIFTKTNNVSKFSLEISHIFQNICSIILLIGEWGNYRGHHLSPYRYAWDLQLAQIEDLRNK